jgi:hypothetical protein
MTSFIILNILTDDADTDVCSLIHKSPKQNKLVYVNAVVSSFLTLLQSLNSGLQRKGTGCLCFARLFEYAFISVNNAVFCDVTPCDSCVSSQRASVASYFSCCSDYSVAFSLEANYTDRSDASWRN